MRGYREFIIGALIVFGVTEWLNSNVYKDAYEREKYWREQADSVNNINNHILDSVMDNSYDPADKFGKKWKK